MKRTIKLQITFTLEVQKGFRPMHNNKMKNTETISLDFSLNSDNLIINFEE